MCNTLSDWYILSNPAFNKDCVILQKKWEYLSKFVWWEKSLRYAFKVHNRPVVGERDKIRSVNMCFSRLIVNRYKDAYLHFTCCSKKISTDDIHIYNVKKRFSNIYFFFIHRRKTTLTWALFTLNKGKQYFGYILGISISFGSFWKHRWLKFRKPTLSD